MVWESAGTPRGKGFDLGPTSSTAPFFGSVSGLKLLKCQSLDEPGGRKVTKRQCAYGLRGKSPCISFPVFRNFSAAPQQDTTLA